MKNYIGTNNKLILKIFVAIFIFASILMLSACGEKAVKPDITVSASSYYFDTETLPTLSVSTKIDGTISWDNDQIVENGIKNYSWTFTPKDTKKYEVVTGSIKLKKVDEIVNGEAGYTYEEQVSLWEDGKSYVYKNCTFASSIASTKKVDLTFINCVFTTGYTGEGGDKCVYLTSFTNLYIQDCIFGGETTEGTLSTAGYALDLNIYNTEVDKIVIKNNKFNTTAGAATDSIAISIKVRLGETDKPTDVIGAPGSILNGVEISGNTFADTCNTIYIGSGPKGSSSANTSTGAFDVIVSDNATDVNVMERYLYPEGQTAPNQLVPANQTETFGNKTTVQ